MNAAKTATRELLLEFTGSKGGYGRQEAYGLTFSAGRSGINMVGERLAGI